MSESRQRLLPPLARGLSARLLLLTIAFVMLSEVLIYVPSIARYRLAFLEERIKAAHLASLALKATPDYVVDPSLEIELLHNAMVRVIVVKQPDRRTLMLQEDMPPAVDASFDLTAPSAMGLIMDAFDALGAHRRIIRVIAPLPDGGPGELEIIMDEAPLTAAMIEYSTNILTLSIVISVVTALLVYIALHVMMVRPMRRLTQAILAFRKAPEAIDSHIVPSGRSDEIGTAQAELAAMQEDLRAALRQKAHLAALGAAVSRINHDLRNLLATADLVSDRLARSDDPEVRRVTPTLIRTIDRAIGLCAQTLSYGRADEPPPNREAFRLRPLVEDVAVSTGLADGSPVAMRIEVPDDLELTADRNQLFRVLLNLLRNAREAIPGEGRIVVKAQRHRQATRIDVCDTGPGLPPRAREHLFVPFSGAARAEGTGLGLAIAHELVRGHGGELSLLRSDSSGTVFRIELPEPGGKLH